MNANRISEIVIEKPDNSRIRFRGTLLELCNLYAGDILTTAALQAMARWPWETLDKVPPLVKTLIEDVAGFYD